MDAALQHIEQTGCVYPEIFIVVFCLAAGLPCLLIAALNAGKIPYRSAKYKGEGLSNNENHYIKVSPSFNFRILRRDSFFFYEKINEMNPESFPLNQNQFEVGYGFFSKGQYGGKRAGLSERGYYLEPDIPLFNHFSVYERFTITRNQDDANSSKNHLSIGVRYTP